MLKHEKYCFILEKKKQDKNVYFNLFNLTISRSPKQRTKIRSTYKIFQDQERKIITIIVYRRYHYLQGIFLKKPITVESLARSLCLQLTYSNQFHFYVTTKVFLRYSFIQTQIFMEYLLLASHIFGTEHTEVNKAGKYFCSHGTYILVGKRYSKLISTTQEHKRQICKRKKKKSRERKRSRKEKGILIRYKLKFRWDGYGKSLTLGDI